MQLQHYLVLHELNKSSWCSGQAHNSLVLIAVTITVGFSAISFKANSSMPTEVAVALLDCKDISRVQDINSHWQQYVQLYIRQPVPEIVTLPQLVERGVGTYTPLLPPQGAQGKKMILWDASGGRKRKIPSEMKDRITPWLCLLRSKYSTHL